jgi:hypothetical protein
LVKASVKENKICLILWNGGSTCQFLRLRCGSSFAAKHIFHLSVAFSFIQRRYATVEDNCPFSFNLDNLDKNLTISYLELLHYNLIYVIYAGIKINNLAVLDSRGYSRSLIASRSIESYLIQVCLLCLLKANFGCLYLLQKKFRLRHRLSAFRKFTLLRNLVGDFW